MRDHGECEEAIFSALANGRPGKAEFLAARCDLKHGHLKAEEPTRDIEKASGINPRVKAKESR